MLTMIAQPKEVYQSPCKINFGLEVLSKREDGYHNINTVFYRLDSPSDKLRVSLSDSFHLSVSDTAIPTDSSNLITKVIQRCSDLKETPLPGIEINLEKNVPFGAGLGGGSADAATAIEIFSDWVTPLTAKEKFEIARSIGADVPFFLMHSYAAVASGIGDVLAPIDFRLVYPMIVVKPKDIVIPTIEAYNRLTLQKRIPTDLASAIRLPIEEWRGTIFNDFESVAFEMQPTLQKIKESLYESGASFALMSGSGSAFFGIYASQEKAQKAFDQFRKDNTLHSFFNE